MLLYRVFPHAAGVDPGDSGSAEYIHRPQGASRWDNPDRYDSWYLSTSPEGAIGETFGNLATWTPQMFGHPSGMRRALATFAVPDELPLFDFDDASNLLSIAMRPSQVVIRNATFTQSKAAALFDAGGWAGVRWWSYHRPVWTNVMLWATRAGEPPARLQQVDELSIDSTPVVEAARALSRPLP